MKMVEIKVRSATTELEKLTARKERAEKTLAKKTEIAARWGCAEWTDEDFRNWILSGNDKCENGDKIYDACFSMLLARDDVNEIAERIERASQRLDKAQESVETYYAELKVEMDAKAYEELMKAEFAKEQEEWAKDGICLEHRYYGKTPSGKRFLIERNCGHTERSWHCFTLKIDGETIFTSGEFWRAYSVIKNH